MANEKWMEVFRAGSHTDSAGNTRYWSTEDLDNIVSLYNDQDAHQAPLVIGHPKTDDPAHGWITGLKRAGNRLMAGVKLTNEWIEGAVKQRLFKKVSIALYDGGLLRHVGLLGAQPPAVKDLAPVQFDEGTPFESLELTVIFQEGNMPDENNDKSTPPAPQKKGNSEEIAALRAQLDALSKKLDELAGKAASFADDNKKLMAANHALETRLATTEFSGTLDKLVAEGKVLPAEVDGLKDEFADLGAADGRMEFAEGEKSLTAKFLERLEARPVLIKPGNSGHFATQAGAKNGGNPGYQTFGETSISGASVELDRQAVEYQEKHPGTSYETAVKTVLMKGGI